MVFSVAANKALSLLLLLLLRLLLPPQPTAQRASAAISKAMQIRLVIFFIFIYLAFYRVCLYNILL